MCTLVPCFISVSPRSCNCAPHVLSCSSVVAIASDTRMCPASPQSITRCAMLYRAARDVPARVDVRNAVHGATMNAHTKLQLRLRTQRAADVQGASHRVFRAAKENQRHPVAGREANQLVTSNRVLELARAAHEVLELTQKPRLLIHWQPRIPRQCPQTARALFPDAAAAANQTKAEGDDSPWPEIERNGRLGTRRSPSRRKPRRCGHATKEDSILGRSDRVWR